MFLIEESEEDISEVNPEEKSLTKELALIRQTNEATYKSLVTIGF